MLINIVRLIALHQAIGANHCADSNHFLFTLPSLSPSEQLHCSPDHTNEHSFPIATLKRCEKCSDNFGYKLLH